MIIYSNGTFQITLNFTEPFVENRRHDPAEQKGAAAESQRVFSVYLNGRMIPGDMDLTWQYCVQTAVEEKFITEVKDGEGISLRFVPVKGQAVISGLAVLRLNP